MAIYRSLALSQLFAEQELDLKYENIHSQNKSPVCLLLAFRQKKLLCCSIIFLSNCGWIFMPKRYFINKTYHSK